MNLSRRLLYFFNFLVLSVLGSGIATAQNGITTSASPSAVGFPVTITATLCGGPKTFHVDFYESNSPSTVFTGTPLATVVKPPGGYATYAWRPPQQGTFYLGVKPEADGTAYCGSNPSGVFTEVISTAPSYYGFYNSSGSGVDETPAISSFANTTWLTCSNPADCNSRLQEAQAYNMHAIVNFAGPGLPAPGSSPSVVQTWLSSWTSNWQSYTSVFAPYVSNGTIAAFYPYDEPFGAEWSAGNNASSTTSYLNSVATTIKQTFPSAKVAMVFTGTLTFTYLTHGQNIIPSSYDWVGIDIYECFSACHDPSGALPDEPYSWYVQTLEGYLYPGQRVILLPATAVYTPGTYSQFEASPPSNLSQLVGDVQSILDLAGADSHVIGVFGFLYQTYYVNGPTNPQVWVGCSDPKMGAMLNVVTEFGTQVERR